MKHVMCIFALAFPAFCLAIDVDNDGVDDTLDRCANTPAGMGVDAQGVPLRNLDSDCDVDPQDVALFKACRRGFGVPYAGGCAFADLDGDVDQSDYATFQLAYTGPLSNCSLEVCDAADNNCNGVVDEGFALDSPSSCGPGCHACPGYTTPFTHVMCAVPETGQCSLSCQGEHYDVNNNPDDGCEIADPATGNHTQAAATFRGSLPCNDGNTDSFSGQIISDGRVHASPAIVGFNAATGAAPDWWSVYADGGFCTNDILATLTVSGGGATSCYRLTMITNIGTYNSVSIPGNGTSTGTITQGSGSYSDDTTIYFRIEKTCNTSVRESVSYTVNYHL